MELLQDKKQNEVEEEGKINQLSIPHYKKFKGKYDCRRRNI